MNDHVSDVTVQDIDGVLVIALSGKILDPLNIEDISDRLEELATSRPSPRMVLDFSDVSHLSSSALGMLTTLNQSVGNATGKLALCCIQPAISEIFRITRLDEVLVISPTRNEALAAVK